MTDPNSFDDTIVCCIAVHSIDCLYSNSVEGVVGFDRAVGKTVGKAVGRAADNQNFVGNHSSVDILVFDYHLNSDLRCSEPNQLLEHDSCLAANWVVLLGLPHLLYHHY